MAPLTWLITGCTSGFGEELTKSALLRGDNVIATCRGSTERLTALQNLGAAVMELDVCDSQSNLDRKINDALKISGDIDVLVNNAGYVDAGLLEDISFERIQRNLHTNLLGPICLTRSVLPTFRQKKSGIVVWVGSCAAWQGEKGFGPYCASKSAMEGVVECFQKETECFNVKHILFEPGYFRTKLASPDNVKWEPLRIQDYRQAYDDMYAFAQTVNGSQPGDTTKAAERMVDIIRGEGLAEGKTTPLRLPLGSDGMEIVKDKCLNTLKIIDEWENFIKSTDISPS